MEILQGGRLGTALSILCPGVGVSCRTLVDDPSGPLAQLRCPVAPSSTCLFLPIPLGAGSLPRLDPGHLGLYLTGQFRV